MSWLYKHAMQRFDGRPCICSSCVGTFDGAIQRQYRAWDMVESSRPLHRWHDKTNKRNMQNGYRGHWIQEQGYRRWGDA